MTQLQKLHYHYFDNWNVWVTYAQNADIVNIESIQLHISYFNIDSNIGNN